MKNIAVLRFLFLSGVVLFCNIQVTWTVSENHVRFILENYNHYMAILKKQSVEISWELEVGQVSGEKRKKAILIANKLAKYIRMMNRMAEQLYEAVKKTENKIPEDMKRQLMLINQVGTPKDLKHIIMTNKVLKMMSKIYSSARVRFAF